MSGVEEYLEYEKDLNATKLAAVGIGNSYGNIFGLAALLGMN